MFVRPVVRALPFSIRTKGDWDAVARPHYLVGILRAADQARREGVGAISVIEFGVGGGNGLLALEEYAAWVEKETGVVISVFGFDTGRGLPSLGGDYRDHPDHWRADDYPMDEQALRQRLGSRTTLIIGDIKDTVRTFPTETTPPVGFIVMDLDLYSSTVSALSLLSSERRRMLRRVVVYFDDIGEFFNHRFAGELLAIREFNARNELVKIDRWHGLASGRVFFESAWLNQMFVVHDLEAISRVGLTRPPEDLPLT